MNEKRARTSRRPSVDHEQGAQPDAVLTTTTAPRLSRRKRGRATRAGHDDRADFERDFNEATAHGRRAEEQIDLAVASQAIAEPTRRRSLALEDVAAKVGGRKRARGLSLDEVTAKLNEDAPPVCDHGPLDFALPARPIAMELIAGRGHYERVIAAVANAHTSVWIATANAKELLVDPDLGGVRGRRRRDYVSMLAVLDKLAERGVELRLLHAELPSGPFRDEIARHPRLVGGGLELRRCPRVHMKAVIVDGALLYLGSANWTGAGLGAKGSGRRNFELGFVTDDAQLLDQVQAIYERVWSGGECDACKLRDDCPGPLIELQIRPLTSATPVPKKKLPARSQLKRRRVPRLL